MAQFLIDRVSGLNEYWRRYYRYAVRLYDVIIHVISYNGLAMTYAFSVMDGSLYNLSKRELRTTETEDNAIEREAQTGAKRG